MKRLLFIAAAAMLVSTAALAQMPPPGPAPWDPGAFWRGAPDNPNERIGFLQDRVNRGRADGSLDPREADRVNGELNGVRGWIHSMHWEDGGRLTPDQRAQVQGRLDQISQQIHWMRHNGW